jgi:hypothetical protein
MGLLQKLFGKMQHHEVYCQGCNIDMTALGGYVSTDGRAYCGIKKEDGKPCIAGGLPTVVDARGL